MTNIQPEDITSANQKSLQKLLWGMRSPTNQFSLILARCNSIELRKGLVQQLRGSGTNIQELALDPTVEKLYAALQAEVSRIDPQGLMVCGLESVENLEKLLPVANRVREKFKQNFRFPLVFWVTDEVLRQFIRLAPDLYSWVKTVEFEVAREDWVEVVRQATDEVFAKVLEVGAGVYQTAVLLGLKGRSPRRVELESAWGTLQSLGNNGELEASWEFILGRDTDLPMEMSRQHLERSLQLWKQGENRVRLGCTLHTLGIWWQTYAENNRAEFDEACDRALDYFRDAIEVFEQAQHPELVGRFINGWGEVLQRVGKWDELEGVALRSLSLNQEYFNGLRLARAKGFLAEIAVQKKKWIDARRYAEEALALLRNEQGNSGSFSREKRDTLNWVQGYQHGWYLFAVARTHIAAGEREEAIACLQTARDATISAYDPYLYINILDKLQESYYHKGLYLEAFQIKLRQREIEQQHGFRAFIGAGRLQPKQAVTNPGLAVGDRTSITEEITASGRGQDVEKLVERIGRDDCKLTVIHGQSGVGKSSILQAGLIPTLWKKKLVGMRYLVPVLQQVYTNWMEQLGQGLTESLAKRGEELVGKLDSRERILEQLEVNGENNLITVLILDQFEEFFFICKDPSQRRGFYEFLKECLAVYSVRVILSLREDYLAYLLEGDRMVELEPNRDILNKKILHHLGNFFPQDARAIIQSLSGRTAYSFEEALIDELVNDLSRDIREVRPIEMQIVGEQLQTERVRTARDYRKNGPKEKVVERYLREVIEDCGKENVRLPQLILYLLTDEKNTRPLKTRTDLERELKPFAADLVLEASQLDLVLEILVQSRLVLLLPEYPNDRYQLVHDYLVSFIRQQQETQLLAELQREKEQRQRSEDRLNRIVQANEILTVGHQQSKREPLEQKLWRGWPVVAAIVVASFTIGFRSIALFQPQEWALFDQYMRLRPQEPTDERIVIIDIDEEDITAIGQWPIPDAVLANLLEKVNSQNPRVIGLDVYRDLPVEPGYEKLVEAIQSTPNLIGVRKVVRDSRGLAVNPPRMLQPNQVSAADMVTDVDGKVRRGLLSLRDSEDNIILTLGTKLALIYLEEEGITPNQIEDGIVKLGGGIFNRFQKNDGGYVRADPGGYQILLS